MAQKKKNQQKLKDEPAKIVKDNDKQCFMQKKKKK